MMEYLVLGLPRSRSSWLSLALNAGGEVPCLHEFISGGGGPSSIERFGSCEINPYINYPPCKTVVILRDDSEVAESLSYFTSTQEIPEGFIERECLLARNKLIEVAGERNALVVEFDEINERLGEILNYLGVKELPFHEVLKSYRVEPMAEDLDLLLQGENFLCR